MTVIRQVVPTAAIPAPRRPRRAHSRWRALLEARWRDRLQELTDLSVAFHDAGPTFSDAGAGFADAGGRQPDESRWLSRRTVVARYALAETDKALHRLTTGEFGRCEACTRDISRARLLAEPETRYCERCALP